MLGGRVRQKTLHWLQKDILGGIISLSVTYQNLQEDVEKMKHKHLAIFVMAVVLTFALALPTLAANAFTDIQGHWAEKTINEWHEHNIINGDGVSGKFRPADTITRAEMASILNKLIGYQESSDTKFSDINKKAWYADDLSKLNKAGVILGNDGKMRPLDKITRAEAAVMIARAMGIEETDDCGNFSDKAKIGKWAKGYVGGLYKSGAIEGINGKFAPTNLISRAEVVTILSRLAGDIVDQPGKFSKNVDGNLIVNSDGAKLHDMTVSGDLIVTEGVGNGDVSIENVTVKGDVILRGCGENSFHVMGGCNIGKLIVTKTTQGTIRVVNEMGESLPLIYVNDGVGGIVVEGNIGQLVVNANVTLHLKNAKVETLSLANEATVNIAKGVSIKQIDVTKNGADTKINNNGTVDKLTSNANGVIMDGNKPGKVTTANGINKPTNSNGATISGGSSSGGGGSSSGGSSSGGSSSGGSSSGGSSSGGSTNTGATTINKIELQLLAPAFAQIPDTADVLGVGYSATTEWFNADGTPASYRWKPTTDEQNTFTANQAYMAVITLTAGVDYEFADNITVDITDGKIPANSFSPQSITGDKQTKTITMVYPATEDKNPFAYITINGSSSVIAGESYTLNANPITDNHLVDPATYTYQWYTSDSAGSNLVAINGATQSTYTATAPSQATKLYYVCKCVAMGKEFASGVKTIDVEKGITADDVNPALIYCPQYGFSYGYDYYDAGFAVAVSVENMTVNPDVEYRIEVGFYSNNSIVSEIYTYDNTKNYSTNFTFTPNSTDTHCVTIDKVIINVTPVFKNNDLTDKMTTKQIDISKEKQITWHIFDYTTSIDQLSGDALTFFPDSYSISINKINSEQENPYYNFGRADITAFMGNYNKTLPKVIFAGLNINWENGSIFSDTPFNFNYDYHPIPNNKQNHEVCPQLTDDGILSIQNMRIYGDKNITDAVNLDSYATFAVLVGQDVYVYHKIGGDIDINIQENQ